MVFCFEEISRAAICLVTAPTEVIVREGFAGFAGGRRDGEAEQVCAWQLQLQLEPPTRMECASRGRVRSLSGNAECVCFWQTLPFGLRLSGLLARYVYAKGSMG